MDRILCVVRELTDDSRRGAGARHIRSRWMRRSTTEVAGSCRSSRVAQFMQYGVYPTALSTRQAYAYPCFPSMTVCGQLATSLLLSTRLPSASREAYQARSAPSCRAAAPSNGAKWVTPHCSESLWASPSHQPAFLIRCLVPETGSGDLGEGRSQPLYR